MFGRRVGASTDDRVFVAESLSRLLGAHTMLVPVAPRATRHASMHLHRVMACVAACVLCSHEPAFAVVGGRVVSADELSARGIVGLRSQAGRLRRGACTGTLIAPNLVLTARHCLDQAEDGPLTTVIFGGSACGTGSPCWCHSFGSRLPYSLQGSASADQVTVAARGATVKPAPTHRSIVPLCTMQERATSSARQMSNG